MNADRKDERRGERRKPAIIVAVIGVILLGIFVLILFFFHSYLESKSSFRPGVVLVTALDQRPRGALWLGLALRSCERKQWNPARRGVTLDR